MCTYLLHTEEQATDIHKAQSIAALDFDSVKSAILSPDFLRKDVYKVISYGYNKDNKVIYSGG